MNWFQRLTIRATIRVWSLVGLELSGTSLKTGQALVTVRRLLIAGRALAGEADKMRKLADQILAGIEAGSSEPEGYPVDDYTARPRLDEIPSVWPPDPEP